MSLLSSSGSAADIGAIEALFVLFAGNAYQSVRTVPGGRLVSVGRFVMPPGVAEGDVPVVDGDYCVDMIFRNPISSLFVCVRNLKISIGVSGRLDNSIVLTEVPTCGDSRSWFSALSAIFYVVPLVFGVLVLLPGDESPCESESMHTEVFSADAFVEGEDDQGCGGDRGDGSGIEGDVLEGLEVLDQGVGPLGGSPH